MRISDWSSDVCSSDLAEMEFGARGIAHFLRRAGIAAVAHQLGQRAFKVAAAARAERFELGQIDRQIVRGEGEHAWRPISGRVVDQGAVGQPEDDDVGSVGGEELAALGLGRIGTARFGRSEERRVGKECGSTSKTGWSSNHYKKQSNDARPQTI